MISDKPELTGELVVDGYVPSNPVVSPNGRWVVYVVATVGQAGEHPVSALWIAAADGSSPPWALTAGAAKDSAPKWAPDSESVFFLSDRVKPGTTQLHRIRLAGGEAESLTTWQGGIRRFLPLADPDLLAFLAPDEPSESDERRKRLRDDVKVRGERIRPARLRLLDLRTREVRTPAGFGERHVVEVAQRPDGGPLAAVTWATPEVDPSGYEPALHLLDLDSGTTQDLGLAAVDASALTWWRAETGWHVAYMALTPPGLVGGEAAFDVAVPASGVAEHRNLTAGMTVCPLELAVCSGELLALFADGLDTAIHRLDPDELTFEEVSRVEGWTLSLTASRDVVAAVVSTAYEPKDVFAGPPQGPLTRLSDTRPELRGVEWGTQERLAYQASDGLPLDGLLILPPGKSRQDGPFPLVTLIHGGPDARYTDSLALKWAPSGQWLAAAGYAVFQPNPRGGQGHGYEFASVVLGAVGLDEWTDTLTGIDLLIADGVADPDRLGIGGWSHGGFVSAWAVGQTDRFKASLVGAGICDWGLLAATSEQRPIEDALSGSTGWEGPGPHPHDKLSPISYASKIRTPVLIMHGEEDTNVPASQAEFFHRALRHYGVEHEYVLYPRENHPILERNHQLDVLRRMREWFDRWLGPAA